MRLERLQSIDGGLALEAGSWTDVIAIVIATLALFGLTGIAGIFSKKARARAKLGRMGVERSNASLVKCIQDHDIKAVKLLLKSGHRPDIHVDGRTPIDVAITSENPEALRVLLAHAEGNAGITALLTSVRERQAAELAKASSRHMVLSGVQEVVDHIQALLAGNSSADDSLELLNFGLDLEVVQTFLLYRVIFQRNFRNLNYSGLIINSDSAAIGPIINGTSSIHSGTAASVVEKVNNQISEKAALLMRRNISIEIRSYDLPPIVHGFLVGDSHLYLAFTEIEHEKLQGGQHPYFYFQRDHGDDMTQHLFRVYRSWFDYHWTKGTVMCKS